MGAKVMILAKILNSKFVKGLRHSALSSTLLLHFHFLRSPIVWRICSSGKASEAHLHPHLVKIPSHCPGRENDDDKMLQYLRGLRVEIKQLEAGLDFNLICREVAVLLEPPLPLFIGATFASFCWSHTRLDSNRKLSTIQQKDTRYSSLRDTPQLKVPYQIRSMTEFSQI